MSVEKQSIISPAGKGGARPGAGRPKGSIDKGNALIREMIAGALDRLGGEEYLVEVARSHPAAFCALIGKTMPLQVTGEGGGAIGLSLSVKFD
jgi:hypothetical protein